MINMWDIGYTSHLITEQPEGMPALDYRFEFAFPITRHQRYESIFEYEVIGWERQVDRHGNERFSTRCKIVSHRQRRPCALSIEECNLGHQHEVYTFRDDDPPAQGKCPEVWGY